MYKEFPEDFEIDIKHSNIKRMNKQSAYAQTNGYKCAAIQG